MGDILSCEIGHGDILYNIYTVPVVLLSTIAMDKLPSFNTLAGLGGGSDNRKTNSKRSTKTMALVLQGVNEDLLLSISEHLTLLIICQSNNIYRF